MKKLAAFARQSESLHRFEMAILAKQSEQRKKNEALHEYTFGHTLAELADAINKGELLPVKDMPQSIRHHLYRAMETLDAERDETQSLYYSVDKAWHKAHCGWSAALPKIDFSVEVPF